MLFLLIALAISGLIVGALGRLVIPGPNPMSIWMTILVGLGGSFVGGLVARLVFGTRIGAAYGIGIVFSVACSALIVAAMARSQRRL